MDLFKYVLRILIYSLYFCNCAELQSSPNVTTCSALDSYVAFSSRISTETVLSSQALFPPNQYYIPPSLVTILSTTDNPCNETQIKTNITNKILLLYTSPNCTDHYKAYVAQKNGAIAVIIASNDDTVHSIPSDAKIKSNTTIPTRGISRYTADFIVRQITVPVNVTGEFGCNYKESPLTICGLDTVGSQWWLDGDYVRQMNASYNDHSIWKKEGFYLRDYYIFLHTANRSDEWYWAITTDPTLQNDASIAAYCAQMNSSDPSKCNQWNTRIRVSEGYAFVPYKNLTISAEACSMNDSYICVASTQSSLAGLDGTYRLFHNKVPLWFREITDCDSTPGVLRLVYDTTNYFQLYDSIDKWTIAQCEDINDNLTVAEYKMNPQLCGNWTTLLDNTLDRDELIIDGTFIINPDQCVAETCIINEAPADSLCLSKNSILHSFLEGTYVQTGVVGPKYKSVEYVKQDPIYYNGTVVPSYLLYFGEFDENRKWWILSPRNMSQYISIFNQNLYIVAYYGAVHCSLMNVVSCQAPWNFYWGVTESTHSDSLFQIAQDHCPPTTTAAPPEYGEEYDYICIDVDDTDAFEAKSTLNLKLLIGGYQINRDNASIPYWTKPVNDYTDDETYIRYDPVFGNWKINTLTAPFSICMTDALYPQECVWYDTVDGSTLKNVMSLRVNNCSSDDVLRRSCSALHSWLQLSGEMDETVSSAHTLFAPYRYRTKPTEIILLELNDNPCDVNGISTDIAGKMVLLFTVDLDWYNDGCSDHYQLYVMEQNNASSAIISSRDNTLSNIRDDDSLYYTTSIPMRGIQLDKAIEIRQKIANGHTVYGTFDCNDSYRYPIEICASQISLEMYGNFQYQAHKKYNHHPVWIRNGYSVYTQYQNVYLYLHTADGDNAWFWAMNSGKINDDAYMIAYCNDTATTTEPTLCNTWIHSDGITDLSNMTLSAQLCNVSDNFFCISSTQSSLAGLSGTYRMYYEEEAVWFREWDDCDLAPAVFMYDNSYFLLMDPMDDWVIASCFMGDLYDYNRYHSHEDEFKFRPDLCTDWYTLIDSSLDDELLWDETLQIALNSECGQECVYEDVVAELLCLDKSAVMHSFLEGEYSANGVVGDRYGTLEYEHRIVYGDIDVNIYLWFYGEISDKYNWWIIAAHNMSVGDAQNYSLVYGYNACSTQNVLHCNGKWNFYWGGMEGQGSWHNDNTFRLLSGECHVNETKALSYDEKYDYLCIDVEDEGYNRSNVLRGGYKITKIHEIHEIFADIYPIWVKPVNDYTNDEIYVYYDEFYGYWQIGKSEGWPIIICHNTNTPYPEKCEKWYDLYSNSMQNRINIRVDECSSSDMLGKTEEKKYGVGIGIAVIVVVFVVALCGIGWYFYDKKCKKKAYDTFDSGDSGHGDLDGNVYDGNNTEMAKKEKKFKKKKKKKYHTQLAIGTDEDDESDGGEDGALTQKTSGGYDMSPIGKKKKKNSESESGGNIHNISDDSDDNDHHHHHDHHDHGIDDSEDGVLMTTKY